MKIISKLILPPKLPDVWDSSINEYQPNFFQLEERLCFIFIIGFMAAVIFGLSEKITLSAIAFIVALSAYFAYRFLMSRMLSPLEFAWAKSHAMNCGITELPRYARRSKLVHLMDKIGELSASQAPLPARFKN